MSQVIWTTAALELLFEQVVKRFGPFSTRETSNYPGGDLNDEYSAFLENFAKVVGANSADAVGMKVMIPKAFSDDKVVAAALKCGFITVDEIASARWRIDAA